MPLAKSAQLQLADWTDVDAKLGRLRALRRAVTQALNRRNERRQSADTELASRTKARLAEDRQIERSVERYAVRHLADLDDDRTRRLNHGSVAVRLVKRLRPLTGSSWADVLEGLRAPVRKDLAPLLRALDARYVRVRLSINKQALADDYNNGLLSDADLEALGVRMLARNRAHIDLDDDRRPD